MFNIPITLVVNDGARIFALKSSVDIDRVAYCKKLLDNDEEASVYGLQPFPRSEIGLTDGRKIPVQERVNTLTQYLDAYRALEDFFTQRACGEESEPGGNVVSLFDKAQASCVSSEGSTPD